MYVYGGRKKKIKTCDVVKKNTTERKSKKVVISHAGNRTPATAVRAPDPNH